MSEVTVNREIFNTDIRPGTVIEVYGTEEDFRFNAIITDINFTVISYCRYCRYRNGMIYGDVDINEVINEEKIVKVVSEGKWEY